MNPFLSYARPTVLTLSSNVIARPGLIEDVQVARYAGPNLPGSRRTVAFRVSRSSEGVVTCKKGEELAMFWP